MDLDGIADPEIAAGIVLLECIRQRRRVRLIRSRISSSGTGSHVRVNAGAGNPFFLRFFACDDPFRVALDIGRSGDGKRRLDILFDAKIERHPGGERRLRWAGRWQSWRA